MSDTHTTGPTVTYTYTCEVCGAHYSGIAPHCPFPIPHERQVLMGIALDAFHRIADADGGRAPLSWALAAVIQSVAAEVLKDPAGYAHALGLPDPVSHLSVAVTTPPERCDQCGKIAPHYRRMTTTQGWVVCGLWQCKACAEKTDTTFVAGLG